MNYILRDQDKWELTAKGKLAGGRIKISPKLGNYIEWPEDFDVAQLPKHQSPDTPIALLSSTRISHNFGIAANKLNHIFSELGWLNKSVKGWIASEQGLKHGAIQSEDLNTGVPYVKWPETIIQSAPLLRSIYAVTGEMNHTPPDKTAYSLEHKANYRAIDGHDVSSKANMLIDNWLYLAEIVHAYKRKLPIEEDLYCDFYIPTAKVYIECWSDNNDPRYLARKDKKIAVYKKYGFRLIELHEAEAHNLDDILPRLLLKFGLQAY